MSTFGSWDLWLVCSFAIYATFDALSHLMIMEIPKCAGRGIMCILYDRGINKAYWRKRPMLIESDPMCK